MQKNYGSDNVINPSIFVKLTIC